MKKGLIILTAALMAAFSSCTTGASSSNQTSSFLPPDDTTTTAKIPSAVNSGTSPLPPQTKIVQTKKLEEPSIEEENITGLHFREGKTVFVQVRVDSVSDFYAESDQGHENEFNAYFYVVANGGKDKFRYPVDIGIIEHCIQVKTPGGRDSMTYHMYDADKFDRLRSDLKRATYDKAFDVTLKIVPWISEGALNTRLSLKEIRITHRYRDEKDDIIKTSHETFSEFNNEDDFLTFFH